MWDSGWLASGGHSNNRVSSPVLFSHRHGWRLTHCGQAEGHGTHTQGHTFLGAPVTCSKLLNGHQWEADEASALPKLMAFSGVAPCCCR